MPSITHIITGLNVGGAERALHTLLTGGLQGPFDNHVISLMDEGHYGPLLREAGIPVTCLHMSPGRPGLGAVAKLLRSTNAQAPDIVQGWMYHGNLAASLVRRFVAPRAALLWNIRLSLEGKSTTKRSTQWAIRLGARLSGHCDAIIYNSLRSRAQHEADRFSAKKGVFIPNGFDTARWQPVLDAKTALSRMLGLSAQTKIVGFVARAHPQKDLPNLFDAFRRVALIHADCHLVCVGREIEECAPLSLDRSRVTFLGQRSDISTLMSGFDLLCLSSWAEGFPNVIGEAMACGVPCVSTDVGDAAAIVAETGWVVPPRDSAALADALSQGLALSGLERRVRGVAARRRIEQCFSLSSAIGCYEALYSDLGSKA